MRPTRHLASVLALALVVASTAAFAHVHAEPQGSNDRCAVCVHAGADGSLTAPVLAGGPVVVVGTRPAQPVDTPPTPATIARTDRGPPALVPVDR